MPKAILEFKLPEEQDDFEAAKQGSAILGSIEDFRNVLRSAHKYDSLNGKLVSTMKPCEIVDAIRESFNDHFSRYTDL